MLTRHCGLERCLAVEIIASEQNEPVDHLKTPVARHSFIMATTPVHAAFSASCLFHLLQMSLPHPFGEMEKGKKAFQDVVPYVPLADFQISQDSLPETLSTVRRMHICHLLSVEGNRWLDSTFY